MVLLGVLLNYFDVATGMILFSIIQLFANGWRVVQWRHYVLWPIFGWYLVGAVISFTFMWMIAFVPDKATVYLVLGLMPFAVEAAAGLHAPEHRMARRAAAHRHGDDGRSRFWPASAGCFSTSSSRRARSTARPPMRPRPSRRPSATSCARFISARCRASATCRSRGDRAGDPARDRRHLARALRDRAHDRPRLPAMDAGDHLRHQRGLSRPRRLAVLARMTRLTY